MKLYLVCEDVDLGYNVLGVFDTLEQANSEMNAIIDAWAKISYKRIGEKVPENVRELITLHKFWITHMTLNDTTRTNGEVLSYEEYYRRHQEWILQSTCDKDT
jgi:hypothetical protein